MTRVRLPFLTAGLTCVAVSAIFAVSACSADSNFSQPRISPPPTTPTPVPTKSGGSGPTPTPTPTATGGGPTPTPTPSGTPSATLSVIPPSLTWTKGQHEAQGVSLVPSNPSESFNFSLAGDTCGNIASAGEIFYNTVQITPGKTNGKCSFTFQDNVTQALGVLQIDNEGN
jgi:hypothetical protein